MERERREALIREILSLEPELFRARCSAQPPPFLNIDVTMSQLKTLFVLFTAAGAGDDGGLRVSDIASRLGVTAATTSTLLDRLVERGLVERWEDPQDRRQHRCRLSAAGERLVAGFFEAARSQSRALLETLTEAELETLLLSVTILIRAAARIGRIESRDDSAMAAPTAQTSGSGETRSR